MRNQTALLLLLLICSLQLLSGEPFGQHFSTCCQKNTRVKIPLKKITSYKQSSSGCTFKSIIFETIKGKRFCVDPEANWVKHHMKAVDLKLKTFSRTSSL
ncbi:eotaxin-like [Trichomycterus rosablanca]|uniref:eotaxin-like n=1 Tax=Trichomycterus rosablanca TaxID=2290929 RepID=UPI002F3562C1